MKEVFEAKQKLLSDLGWVENPFVKDLRTHDPQTFLKYYCAFEAQTILQRLAFDTKACMLLGPKGVGKTSALYFAYFSLPREEFLPIFFKEPPKSLEGLAQELGFFEKKGFLEAFFEFLGRGEREKKVSRAELVDFLKRKRKKVVFFLDEAHLQKNGDMHMEFKYLLDDVPNLRMVVSALGRKGFPDSLVQLIGETNVFKRNNFSKEEMVQIIQHRINAAGGKTIHPFPQEFLDGVLSERNLLSPRYVFDELNNFLAEAALGKSEWKEEEARVGDALVQSVVAQDLEEKITTAHAEWWIQLSPSQKQVVGILVSYPEGLTLSDVRDKSGLSQNTAFNALYQLRGEDKAELARKPQVPFPLVVAQTKLVGSRKKNVYFIDQKIRNLFTMH